MKLVNTSRVTLNFKLRGSYLWCSVIATWADRLSPLTKVEIDLATWDISTSGLWQEFLAIAHIDNLDEKAWRDFLETLVGASGWQGSSSMLCSMSRKAKEDSICFLIREVVVSMQHSNHKMGALLREESKLTHLYLTFSWTNACPKLACRLTKLHRIVTWLIGYPQLVHSKDNRYLSKLLNKSLHNVWLVSS